MTKALPELEKAAVADSGWAEPQMYMGFVFFRMGESENANASLEKAYRLDPQRHEITWLRAYLLTAEEKVDDAIALLLGNESVPPQGGEAAEPGEGPAPAGQDSSQAASPASTAVSDTATAGTATPAAEVTSAVEEPLDLKEVVALKDAGKQDEAAKALEELLAGKLGEAGFTMKKEKKLSAMEKMKLMMQEKQGK